jgi:GNAT superfamily N-acetyltransferase
VDVAPGRFSLPEERPVTAIGDSAGLVIRPALREDGEAVAAMASALLVDEGKPPTRFSAADFRRDGFGPHAAFSTVVAELDHAIVGYALFYPGYDTESVSRGLFLADLFVARSARRQGIGRALVAAVARACLDHGGEWLFWLVLPANHGALAFYQRLGAVDHGSLPRVLEGDALRALLR